MNIKLNLIGKIFGSLTVINSGPDKIYKSGNRVKRWLCKCICGEEILVISNLLLRSEYPKISCGCKNYTGAHGNRKLKDPKIASIRSLIKRYRAAARNKSKNIVWDLTEKQANSFFNNNCFYCGTIPMNSYNVYMTKTGKANTKNVEYAKTAEILFNGIDRKDSSLSYTIDNCVSCCKICNLAKNELSVDDFYKWIERIAIYNGFKK